VAIGLALDTTYSYLAGLLGKGPWRRVLDLLTSLGLVLYVPQLDNQEAILRGLEEFRTHLGGRLTIILLADIGQGRETNQIDPGTLRAALEELRRLAPAAWPAAQPALAS